MGGSTPYISLVGLDVLSSLNVYAHYRGLYNALNTVATWSSACKGTASASLMLELEVSQSTCVGLGDWVTTVQLKQHLMGSASNGGIMFRGTFTLSLKDPVYVVHDPDYIHTLSVAAALSEDSDLDLFGVNCIRYHGDTLVM